MNSKNVFACFFISIQTLAINSQIWSQEQDSSRLSRNGKTGVIHYEFTAKFLREKPKMFGEAFFESNGPRFVYHWSSYHDPEFFSSLQKKTGKPIPDIERELACVCGFDGKKYWIAYFSREVKTKTFEGSIRTRRAGTVMLFESIKNFEEIDKNEGPKKRGNSVSFLFNPIFGAAPLHDIKRKFQVKNLSHKELVSSVKKSPHVEFIQKTDNYTYAFLLPNDFWAEKKNIVFVPKDKPNQDKNTPFHVRQTIGGQWCYILQLDDSTDFAIARFRCDHVSTFWSGGWNGPLPRHFESEKKPKLEHIPESWFTHQHYGDEKTKLINEPNDKKLKRKTKEKSKNVDGGQRTLAKS